MLKNTDLVAFHLEIEFKHALWSCIMKHRQKLSGSFVPIPFSLSLSLKFVQYGNIRSAFLTVLKQWNAMSVAIDNDGLF